MALDLKKIKTSIGGAALTDPRKIFTTLAREPRFKRPSDEQADVLDGWFKVRSRANNTIKMNTGAGKTVVGLLVLQSSMNEGVSPAVYIAPDKFLASQVIKEAVALGIKVTTDENDSEFVSGKAILVINIWKLVNGFSAFGVGNQGIRIPIGSIVVDDAHACLSTVADQFKLRIGASHPVYQGLLGLFRDELRRQSVGELLDIEANDPRSIMQVPFWAWKDRKIEVTQLIHAHREDADVKFPWRLLRDVLDLCQCVIGGKEMEIAPRFLPIDVISAFTRAQRRIYMTATLADDGILVSHFQANADEIIDPIRPKGAGDIGDRMILAPQEINPAITVEEVKALAASIATTRNVAVIVPSKERSKFWSAVANQTLNASNIGEGVEKMKAGHVGLSVLINKYDGVDLPGAACELLIIDGLPEVYGLSERIEMTMLQGTESQLLRQIQRLEQGMGRGVRSSEDHCVVLLLGAKLTQRLHLASAREKFSAATRAQLDLGRQVTEQVRGESLDQLKPIIAMCLDRDPEWVETARSAIANAPDASASFVDPAVKDLRLAFDYARQGRFDLACPSAQHAVNREPDNAVKGYYKQQLAEYTHHIDPPQSQGILLSAVGLNRRVLRPLHGISYTRLTAPQGTQVNAASEFMTQFLEPNDLVVWLNGLIEDLAWDPESTDPFEAAIRDLGKFLGFGSQRPEAEIGKGPDNLWAVGGLNYLVIECKSGATNPQISKENCNQLGGSVSWFKSSYDLSCHVLPVLIHPYNQFDRYSSPLPETRIVSMAMLQKLKDNLRLYGASLAVDRGYANHTKIGASLKHFALTGAQFVPAYTVGYSVSKT